MMIIQDFFANRIKKSLIDNYGWVEILNLERMGVKIHNYHVGIFGIIR